MKYLYIIRHAKAEKYVSGQEDHDRNLISVGVERANKLSMWLKNVEPNLEKIFVSSSKRTVQTSEVIQKYMNDISIEIKHELYSATKEDLINFLLFIEEDADSIGLVGHEPSLKQLAIYLTGAYSKGLESVLNKHFSTASVIVLVLNIKRWDQISERIGVVSHYYDSLSL